MSAMPNTTYPAPAGPLPAYLATPTGKGPWPGVVMVHEGFGMTHDIKRITDRFAANGYLSVTPALFHRGNKIGCIVRTFKTLSTGEGTALDDIIAARNHLVADSRCTGKVGVVGFCMGGGSCLMLAPRGVFDASAPITATGRRTFRLCRSHARPWPATVPRTGYSEARLPDSRRCSPRAMYRETLRSTPASDILS
jgi:dienelactone hydrolase